MEVQVYESFTPKSFTMALAQRLAPLGERVYANVSDWIDRGEVTLEYAVSTLGDLYGVDDDGRAKILAEIKSRMEGAS